MTELELKARHAWALMMDWAMPAGIALDFVQDVAGNRTAALESLVTESVLALANSRPSVDQPSGGTFADYEAGAIGAAILEKRLATAGRLLKSLRERLLTIEMMGPTEMVGPWLEWCKRADRALILSFILHAAAFPNARTEETP